MALPRCVLLIEASEESGSVHLPAHLDALGGALGEPSLVICLDADAPDSKRVLFIGTDNFRAGQESGKRMAQLLKGQGRIAIVSIPGNRS